MTNTQQTILEPAEEAVQLTELKPVEQSWIKEADGEKEDEAACTDGLKALRRRRELEHLAGDYPARKRKPETRELSDEFDEDELEFYGVNGDFEYLEEEVRSPGDEIYVYRQRDSCSSEPEDGVVPTTARETEKLENVIEQQQQQQQQKKRARGRPRKKRRNGAKEQPVVEEKEPAAPIDDSTEKELQSKINDIIQANYLLEHQDNNNESEPSANEKEPARPTRQPSDEEGDGAKKYRCGLCKARFKGSGGLRNHYKVVHASGPLFKCDECGKEFPLKERLKLHVRTHTGFKPYKCAECDKSFARGGQLVQHRRTHSQVKPYRCELCAGTFTCAANLALHVKRHNGQKDHKCEICGRGFVRRDALKKHLECLHRDVKSFLCVICNKTFKGHLPQHMRTHAQDRPHGCATCGQRFAQKSQLTVHQRTHSGQRPFRCLVCWQAFAHSTALKLHTRRHTGERPFKCAECGAGFTQLPHWKKHMKCIHGRSEPYGCARCGSFFRIKNELEAHEKECAAAGSREPAESPVEEETPGLQQSASALARFRSMSVEKMRLLLAVLLKRISKPERLDELGFGKRLIDEVLVDSLLAAGKTAERPRDEGLAPEFEALRKNLEVFLEWTVPREHWLNFRRMDKTPEEVLETLTAT